MYNLETKYECPICNKYRRLEKLAMHIEKHVHNVVYQRGSGAQYKGTASPIMVKVPENVKRVAASSFQLRKLGFVGGQTTGWKRAKQLSTKSEIPIEDVRYIRNWFARHIFTSYPSYRMWQKAGRPKDDKNWHNKHGVIAWIIWGSDAALNWINSSKVLNLLNKHYPGKNYKKIKGLQS